MKKLFLITIATALLAGGAFAAKTASKDGAADLFKANVEALADDEIIVGDLCAYQPDWRCVSLGEVFKDNIKAN